MAVNNVLFTGIQSGLRSDKVVFRLIHFWEARRPTQGNILMGIELLLIDEKGTTIQGFIAPNRIARFQPLLKRNSIYRLTNYYATDNKVMFRVTEHEFTICFTDLTTFLKLDQTAYSIEPQLFRFYSFPEFEAEADKRGDLYDAIGHIRLINNQSLHDHPTLIAALERPSGQKDRVTVHLQLRDGPVVNVYLWDNAASEFVRKFQATTTTPKVLLVTTVNPKRLGAMTSLTSMSPSRVFFDSEVGPTTEYLGWLDANADSLATVNAAQVTKSETLTIAEILQFLRVQPSQVASFICTATISDMVREAGWYYVSCTRCSRKCIRGPTSFVCSNCSNQNAVGIIKYRVEFTVQDDTEQTVFVFLDDAATPLTGISATQLMDSLQDNGHLTSGGDVLFPECFSDSIGTTHKFMVKVTDYNFRATRQTITVLKIMEPEDVPHPDPPAPTYAINGDPTYGVQLLETDKDSSTIVGPSTNQGHITAADTAETSGADIAGAKPKRARLDA